MPNNSRELEKSVLNAVVSEINFKFKNVVPRIERGVIEILRKFYVTSPHYRDLSSHNSVIAADMGLAPESISGILGAIFNTLSNEVNVVFTPFKISGGNIVGSLRIGIFRTDFAGVLSLSEGYTNNDGEFLHWLEWLLVKGDSIVIFDHSIDLLSPGSERSYRSRSGLALMVPFGNWRVSPEFSGTVSDNWITRIISDNLTELELRIKQLIEGLI